MSFVVPQFNLVARVYTGPWLTKSLRLSSVPCNLAFSRRIHDSGTGQDPVPFGNAANAPMFLLVPLLTDIRAFPTYPVSDIVEVPSGSGRWYQAYFVDDIGKGFPNEHRAAMLCQVSPQIDATAYAGSQWPTPMP